MVQKDRVATERVSLAVSGRTRAPAGLTEYISWCTPQMLRDYAYMDPVCGTGWNRLGWNPLGWNLLGWNISLVYPTDAKGLCLRGPITGDWEKSTGMESAGMEPFVMASAGLLWPSMSLR